VLGDGVVQELVVVVMNEEMVGSGNARYQLSGGTDKMRPKGREVSCPTPDKIFAR
jgi:hypothetical protein